MISQPPNSQAVEGQTRCSLRSVSSYLCGNRDASSALCVTTTRIVMLRGMQFQQQVGDRDCRSAVEIACGFIAQQQLRLPNQRSRDRGTLLLSAGKLGRKVIEPV